MKRNTVSKKDLAMQFKREQDEKLKADIVPIVQSKEEHDVDEKEVIKIMNLNTKDLISSQQYQRDVNQQEVAYIASNFDIHQFGVIKVSYRDGKYYVYDGQHRIAAFKMANGNQDGIVKCEVHYGLTYEDEAKYFADQYLGAKKVDIIYRWRALYEAKEEPVFSIVNSVRAIGIEIKFTKSKAPNRIIAYKQLSDMWETLGADESIRILNLLKNVWENDMNCFDGSILLGMREFFRVYSNEIRDDVFIRQMKKQLPSLIVVEGKKDILSRTGLNYAKVIWSKYNHGLKKKLDYKFRG